MLIQRIKYFLQMPWSIILSDAQKYNAMRKKYFVLRKEAKQAQKNLVNDLGEVVKLGAPCATGCIVSWVRCATNPRNGEVILRFYHKKCEYFIECRSCGKNNCQHYKANQEYFVALEKMNKFKMMKDEYWERNLFVVR